MRRLRILAFAAPVTLLWAAAVAQAQGTGHGVYMCKNKQGMTGMHHMPATVKAVDAKTGVIA